MLCPFLVVGLATAWRYLKGATHPRNPRRRRCILRVVPRPRTRQSTREGQPEEATGQSADRGPPNQPFRRRRATKPSPDPRGQVETLVVVNPESPIVPRSSSAIESDSSCYASNTKSRRVVGDKKIVPSKDSPNRELETAAEPRRIIGGGDGSRPVRREFRGVHGKGAQSAQGTHNALLRAGVLREGRLVQVAPEQKVIGSNARCVCTHLTRQVSRVRSPRVFSPSCGFSRFPRLEIVSTLCLEVTSLTRESGFLAEASD